MSMQKISGFWAWELSSPLPGGHWDWHVLLLLYYLTLLRQYGSFTFINPYVVCFRKDPDPPGNWIWSCMCSLFEGDHSFH
jgi:hypothetical protein